MRVLGISGAQRSVSLPEVPTLKEQGIDVVQGGWLAVMAPKGLSDAQVAYWESMLERGIAHADWKHLLEADAGALDAKLVRAPFVHAVAKGAALPTIAVVAVAVHEFDYAQEQRLELGRQAAAVVELVRRGVPVKNFTKGESESAAGGTIRRVYAIQEGIPTDAAREIVKFLKDAKVKKAQASIQGDQVRVTSPSRDELQEVIRLLKGHDFGVALAFGNYR